MENIKCNLCGGTDFYNVAGFYYCNECQTQTQELREQVVDEGEDDLPTQKTSRKIKSSKKLTDEQHITSWECYNYILHGLVKEIIEIGASSDLKQIVQMLWFRYLEKIEFFTSNPNDPPKLAAVYSETDAEIVYGRKSVRRRSRSRSPASSSDVTSTEASSKIQGRKKQRRALAKSEYDELMSNNQFSEEMTSIHNQSLSSLKTSSVDQTLKKLPLQFNKRGLKELTTCMGEEHLEAHIKDFSGQLECHPATYKLASSPYVHSAEIVTKNKLFSIIYLGLLITKDKLQLGDLLRYVREGHISYQNVSQFLPEGVLGKYTKKHLARMNIQNSQFILSHEVIRRMAANVSKQISVTKYLPIQNIEELVKRYCEELNFPDEICMYTISLISLLKPKLKHWDQENLIPNYEGRAMAFIIFVSKLFFGLDDQTENYLSDFGCSVNKALGCTKMFTWKNWISYIQYRKLVISKVHFIYCEENIHDKCELYIDFVEQQKQKYESNDSELTSEQEIWTNILEKLKNNQENCKNFPNFHPSPTPFRSIVNQILDSEEIEMELKQKNVNFDILKANFDSLSMEYLYSPYNYLQSIHKNRYIAVKHRGVNNNLNVRKFVNNFAVIQRRRKEETKGVLTSVITEVKKSDKLIKEPNEKNHVSKEIENYLKEESIKLFLKLFEESNLRRFRKNIKKMKNKIPEKEKILLDQVGKSSADYFEEIEQNPENNKLNEIHFHYNPFERYWLRIEDVSRSNKTDFEQFYKTLPYNFRLLLEECARVSENSLKELYEELINVEIFIIFLENRYFVGDNKSHVFLNDNLSYLKERVSKLW